MHFLARNNSNIVQCATYGKKHCILQYRAHIKENGRCKHQWVLFPQKYAFFVIFDPKNGKNGTERILKGSFHGPRYCGDDILASGKSSSPLGQPHMALEGAVPYLGVRMDPAHGVLRLGPIRPYQA